VVFQYHLVVVCSVDNLISGVIFVPELITKLLQPSNGGLTPSESISEMLRQAERWLRFIRSVDFRSVSNSARQELRYPA